jgi:hypothetical protein
MHVGRATGHDHSPQAFFAYGFPDNLLPWFRAHVDVIGAMGDVFDPTDLFGDRFDIDGPGNIDPAMADKDAQSLHDSLLGITVGLPTQASHMNSAKMPNTKVQMSN